MPFFPFSCRYSYSKQLPGRKKIGKHYISISVSFFFFFLLPLSSHFRAWWKEKQTDDANRMTGRGQGSSSVFCFY